MVRTAFWYEIVLVIHWFGPYSTTMVLEGVLERSGSRFGIRSWVSRGGRFGGISTCSFRIWESSMFPISTMVSVCTTPSRVQTCRLRPNWDRSHHRSQRYHSSRQCRQDHQEAFSAITAGSVVHTLCIVESSKGPALCWMLQPRRNSPCADDNAVLLFLMKMLKVILHVRTTMAMTRHMTVRTRIFTAMLTKAW